MWLPLMRSQLGTWPATQACALTGNPTGKPFGSQAGAQPLSHPSQALFYLKAVFYHLSWLSQVAHIFQSPATAE